MGSFGHLSRLRLHNFKHNNKLREKSRKKMGEINYNIAKEKADWEKNFSKLEEIYLKLLKMNLKK